MLIYLIAFYVLGWVSFAFSIFDVGRYSITLLYLAAIPFCLKLTSRSVCFLIFPLASAISAVLVAVFEEADARVASNAAQQFLALIFAAGIAAIDWRRYLDYFSKILVAFAVPIVAYGGYQMIARVGHLPYAFLPVTNQQEYAVGGLQRGWEKPSFPRASSVFVEPSEFGYFCLWLGIFGITAKNPRVRVASFALTAAGTLFSQSLSAVIGLVILLGVYFITNPIRVSHIRQLGLMLAISAVALLFIPRLMPEAFDRFSQRIEQAFAFDNRADSDRVNHIPQNWRTFREAPIWGHGLANVPVDDDQNGTSITYSLLLMERGLVGTALFLVPWLLVAVQSWNMSSDDSGRSPALLLTALNLYCFCTFATMYYLPFWFSLGVTASLTMNTSRSEGLSPLKSVGLHSYHDLTPDARSFSHLS
jgi:hypothetical protein